MTLGKVNEKQSIKAPAGAEPIEKLFGEIGVNPLELLGAMQGGEGAGLGELLEGVGGESSGSGEESVNPEEIEVPSTENLKEAHKNACRRPKAPGAPRKSRSAHR